MFSGNRRFNGRQGEQIYNEELYTLYELLKHFLDVPSNPDPKFGPQSGLEKPGALWLDRQNYPGYGHLMYRDSDQVWKPMFDDWFKIIKEIRNPEGEPADPKEGQLWINDSGVLHWYNGSMFVPIKSRMADAVEFDANSFENFLIIDPLKMTGGYIVENLSKLAQIANGINEWKPNTLYQIGDLVYHTDHENETKFYQYVDTFNDWCEEPHTSELTFEEELNSGFLVAIDLKAQYLIPSEVLDRIFIDGYYAGDDVYEKLSDVCIQISLSLYQGKIVAAVHVNPVALKNIRKRIVRIEKDPTVYNEYGMVKAGPDNTEYYGFINGFGQFLNKSEDYIVKANGIQLVGEALELYDFVYCITYDFETRIKNPGVLYRDTVKLSNQTCIWIGQIDPSDKLLIFTQGLCLEDFYYNYSAYDSSGLVKFNGYDKDGKVTDDPSKMVKPLFESKTDVAIMRFNKKTNIGIFTPEILENDEIDPGETQSEGIYSKDSKSRFIASIEIPADFIQPLIFVQGPNLNLTLGDYTIEDCKGIIKDAIPGSAYYIVDAVRKDGFNMYVEEGVVNSQGVIPISDPEILSGECQALLFVDGFYISIRDFDTSDPTAIKIHGLTPGQEYVLLKDRNDERHQLLFDGEISFTTIPMSSEIDDALVYIGNTAIIDGAACTTTSKSGDYAVSNEVKLIIADGKQQWCAYNAGNKAWYPIEDEDYIVMLDASSSGYTVDTRTINILQNFGEVDCTYYAYRFADNIEKPLIKGYTSSYIEQGDELFYKIDFRHTYPMGENALSVWMNGVKQNIKEHYIVEQVDNDTETIVGHPVTLPGDNEIKVSVEWTQDISGDANEVTMHMFVETKKAIDQTLDCNIKVDGKIIKAGFIKVTHGDGEKTKVLTAVNAYPFNSHKNITIAGTVVNMSYTADGQTVIVNPAAFRTVNLIGESGSKGKIVQGFLLPKPTDAYGNELEKNPTCFYIIERPETGEIKACVTEELTEPVGINTYITNEAILAPGVPRVFIDGYRQPQSAYMINNMNTITLIEPVLTDAKNTVMVSNEYDESKFIEVDSRSTVTVEVRRDYRLREKTVELTAEILEYILQGATAVFDSGMIFAKDQKLPHDLFMSKLTEINIFINGAAYGKDFTKMKDQDAIVLTNLNIVKLLQPGDRITFEWR